MLYFQCFFLRATNAENGELNKIKNQLTGNYGGVSEVARAYKAKGVKWVAIGDENYGKYFLFSAACKNLS